MISLLAQVNRSGRSKIETAINESRGINSLLEPSFVAHVSMIDLASLHSGPFWGPPR